MTTETYSVSCLCAMTRVALVHIHMMTIETQQLCLFVGFRRLMRQMAAGARDVFVSLCIGHVVRIYDGPFAIDEYLKLFSNLR